MNINLTLLFQLLFFAGFVWFCKQFVWPPIMAALQTRKTTIADGLAAAEKGREAEQVGRREAAEIVAAAKAQAGEIIGRAETRSGELITAAKETAREEGARILAGARSEIASEVGKAKTVLRAQVGELAVAGAQQILRREIDAAAHTDMLNRLTDKI